MICRDAPARNAINQAFLAIAIKRAPWSGTALSVGWHNSGRTHGCHCRLPIKTTEHLPMKTLINRLIALLPNSMDEVHQTHWKFHHGINPLPAWTVIWLDELQTLFHGRDR